MTEKPRVAWVTGAGKGIGRALALRLADEGWMVAASARTANDLVRLAGEHPHIHAFPLDVTDAGASARVFTEITARLGPVDLAVLNAGTYIRTGAAPFDAAAFEDQFRVNVSGVVTGLSLLLPPFIARKTGRIAVMSSVAGYRGLPGAAAYGATKAALINMCEALKIELEPHGVAVSVICPGFVETPLTARNDFPMPFLISAEEAARYIAKGLAAGRFRIAFPPLFAALMRLLRLVPDSLFFTLARRMRREI
ncbi:MAG: SDR family NAD(P)-dependent oxidoreductase [Proteobacteria bacterium]|nr:SDR family NAD(P)-dependent oxidoreductase [Pseudomonadota bacterium]